MNKEAITIDYFSDILCVWAWIAQRRIDELNETFKNTLVIQHKYIDIFGDVPTRINEQWINKGNYDGFSDHVVNSAKPYEATHVNPEIWRRCRPTTSANAHMVIKAIELCHGSDMAIQFAHNLRKAFFIESEDISDMKKIFEIVALHKLDISEIENQINSGNAIAALMGDYQLAKKIEIKGSPCFVMNDGRQVLFGNVGYRVIRANIEEFLTTPEHEASWC